MLLAAAGNTPFLAFWKAYDSKYLIKPPLGKAKIVNLRGHLTCKNNRISLIKVIGLAYYPIFLFPSPCPLKYYIVESNGRRIVSMGQYTFRITNLA